MFTDLLTCSCQDVVLHVYMLGMHLDLQFIIIVALLECFSVCELSEHIMFYSSL